MGELTSPSISTSPVELILVGSGACKELAKWLDGVVGVRGHCMRKRGKGSRVASGFLGATLASNGASHVLTDIAALIRPISLVFVN